ncbi:hypothetical protein QTO34_018229 [Cnephaeus nilssonii]|uniref:RRM domain-containing protein n=1 Tax=Cnephaeus nilssonii TaxID=3371016 RepID=A0AA40LNM5_CNENI|nr:hypothetical protein QTO34_018229 [Eptesicus nilssonii]
MDKDSGGKWVIMETAESNQIVLKFSLPENCKTSKNYDDPEVLRHTFETLSNLHMLLPNNLIQLLYCYRSGLDKQQCMRIEGECELSLPDLETDLSKTSVSKRDLYDSKAKQCALWKRKIINNENHGWKKCHLLNKSIKDPPMSTIVVRWLKRNMKPTEDLQSVIQKLSVFGPIKSVSLCGRQSAIVVFENMTSACHAVSAFKSRTPGTMVHCSWQHQFMSKDVRVSLPKTYIHDPVLTRSVVTPNGIMDN